MLHIYIVIPLAITKKSYTKRQTQVKQNTTLENIEITHRKGFPGGSAGKESACSAGDLVQFLGWEDPLEKGQATHSSILAWRIPMDRGARRATVHEIAKSQA